jgi:hypothetical protein
MCAANPISTKARKYHKEIQTYSLQLKTISNQATIGNFALLEQCEMKCLPRKECFGQCNEACVI